MIKTVFECDNGCGAEIDEELITQMAKNSYLMLVCPSCVFDEWLSDWEVELSPDPR